MQDRSHSRAGSSSGTAPEWRDEDAYGIPRANFPGSGLVVLVGVILMGMIPAAYYMWARPRLEKAYAEQIQSAPTSAHGRLEKWFEFGSAMIHHRLTEIGRFSDQVPWMVTHAVRIPGANADQVEAFGVDLSELGPGLAHLDDMAVVVDLPAPRDLGPLHLRGERARYVPVYGPDDEIFDATLRLRDLVLWFLEDLPQALSEDIEGASLELRIGGEVILGRNSSLHRPAPEGIGNVSGQQGIQPISPDGR